jgi:hypothetical protein
LQIKSPLSAACAYRWHRRPHHIFSELVLAAAAIIPVLFAMLLKILQDPLD